MQELVYVLNAKEKVERTLLDVKLAKDKVLLLNLFKFNQECMPKLLRSVKSVKELAILLEKEENVKFVWVKKFSKKRKLWKFLLTKVFLIIHLFLLQEKEIKSYLFFNI